MQKTILMTVGESIIARNTYAGDLLPELRKRAPDARLVLVVQPDKIENYRESFGRFGVEVVGYKRSSFSRYETILFSLARSGIKSHTNLWSKMRSYLRGDSSFIATMFKRFLTFCFGGSVLYKRLLRFLILATPAEPKADELMRMYRPDMLFAASLTNFEFDVPLAKAAKKRGVKIVGMGRSWDNFSSHGLVRVVPNVLIMQNGFLKDMAAIHQDMHEQRIPMHIIGVPHYDIYKDEGLLESREEFFKKNKLDSNKKLILYGAMGEFLFIHEKGVADVLERIIEENKLSSPAQVIFRAHPRFRSSLDHVKVMKHVALDRIVESGEKGFSVETGEAKHFINLLHHADVVVTGASTIAIDAAVMGRPIICVAFDGIAERVPHWNSVKRFYDTYTHFEALMATGGARRADTPDELARYINEYFKHPERDAEARKEILRLFVNPFNGNATERLISVLAEEINNTRKL